MKTIEVQKKVFDNTLSLLNNGVIPWARSASQGELAFSHGTGAPYSLHNQLLLPWGGEYVTFNQAKKEGGTVRKGEKAFFIVFWKMLEFSKKGEEPVDSVDDTEKEGRKVPFLQYYCVFHISQCEGVKPTKKGEKRRYISDSKSVEKLLNFTELYCRQRGIDTIEKTIAGYFEKFDSMYVPSKTQLQTNLTSRLGLLRGLVESTGPRVGRNTSDPREPLIVEVGAVFLARGLLFDASSYFKELDSEEYCQKWAEWLKGQEPGVITYACKQAEKALEYLFKKEDYTGEAPF